jgi:Flp pilus assembly protein TadD
MFSPRISHLKTCRTVAQTVLFGAILTACAPQNHEYSKDANPYAPTDIKPGVNSVDGLIVGHRLTAAREHELALKAYLRAASEQGMNVDVLSALGSANLQLGRMGQAETLLRRAIKMDDSFGAAWNNLGVVLMETGQIAEAARVFQIAFGLDKGQSSQIRDNLRLALTLKENPSFEPEEEHAFSLVRRGNGTYQLLSQI